MVVAWADEREGAVMTQAIVTWMLTTQKIFLGGQGGHGERVCCEHVRLIERGGGEGVEEGRCGLHVGADRGSSFVVR